MPHKDSEVRRAYWERWRRKQGMDPQGSPEHREKTRAASVAARGGRGTSYGAIHRWLKKDYPKKGVCEECGEKVRTDYAFLHHPQPPTANRADYRELCRRCHNLFDGKPPFDWGKP